MPEQAVALGAGTTAGGIPVLPNSEVYATKEVLFSFVSKRATSRPLLRLGRTLPFIRLLSWSSVERSSIRRGGGRGGSDGCDHTLMAKQPNKLKSLTSATPEADHPSTKASTFSKHAYIYIYILLPLIKMMSSIYKRGSE